MFDSDKMTTELDLLAAVASPALLINTPTIDDLREPMTSTRMIDGSSLQRNDCATSTASPTHSTTRYSFLPSTQVDMKISRPDIMHSKNTTKCNKSQPQIQPFGEVAIMSEGKGRALQYESFHEMPSLKRRNQNSPRSPRCDFFSFSQRYYRSPLVQEKLS